METGTCSLRSVFKNGSCSNCPLLLMFFSLGSFIAGFASILIDFTALYYRRRRDVGALRAVPKCMIGKDTGEHGFGDGGGADADARIVAPCGLDRRWLAAHVDRATWKADA